MNRESYLKSRRLNRLGDVAFQYYKEQGGTHSLRVFNQTFPQFFIMNTNIDWEGLWDMYDAQFEVVLLFDVKGAIIQVN